MKIKCVIHPEDIKTDYMVPAKNARLLESGKEYTLANSVMDAWFTTYYLEEFPDIPFNSVWFE